jgi:hypothetical protein
VERFYDGLWRLRSGVNVRAPLPGLHVPHTPPSYSACAPPPPNTHAPTPPPGRLIAPRGRLTPHAPRLTRGAWWRARRGAATT